MGGDGGALLNQRVMIQDLGARPDLNGQFGVAVSYDQFGGRYTVEVDGGGGQIALKANNVVLVPPPPPPRMPSFSSDWTQMRDPSSGGMYWYNNRTGASQWESPHPMMNSRL